MNNYPSALLMYTLLKLILYADLPETKSVIISAHGMLPILEILENCRRRDVISNLLKIVNAVGYFHYP